MNALNLKKIAVYDNLATYQFTERYRFTNCRKSPVEIVVSPAEAADFRRFSAILRNAGANLPANPSTLRNELKSAVNSKCSVIFTHAGVTGWSDDEKQFVLVNEVIGNSNGLIVGTGLAGRSSVRDKIDRAGSKRQWKETVGTWAKASSSTMFAISVALAAPLLKAQGQSSFSLCLFAKSRTGKSMATLAAASMFGFSKETDLVNWNSTDNALEACLPEFNDTLFAVDDIQSSAGNDKERYQRVRQLAYRLAQGSEKRRMGTHPGKWRTIVFTSSETSISELARSVGMKRREGEHVRLIDVPTITDNKGHIFDRVAPNDLGNDEQEIRRRFGELVTACRDNHGEAFVYYLESLIKFGSTRRYVQKRIDYFVKKTTLQEDGPTAVDIANKFGIIYAAGRLGIKFGLLPWDKRDLFDAISKSFIGSRDLVPDRGNLHRKAIAELKTFLSTIQNVSAIKRSGLNSVAGYKTDRANGSCAYIVKCDEFNSAFSSTELCDVALRWLKDQNYISMAKTKTGKRRLKKQFKWPDGLRRRSYEIKLKSKSLF